VDILVFSEGSSGHEAFSAGGTGVRPVAGVQCHVQLIARLVRKRLVADAADEAPRRRVDRIDVVLEVRRGEVGLCAREALVRTPAGVLQDVQLQAVVEVEPRATLRAAVGFPGAVDRPLVMMEGACGREGFVALVAGRSRLRGAAVARRDVSPQSPLCSERLLACSTWEEASLGMDRVPV